MGARTSGRRRSRIDPVDLYQMGDGSKLRIPGHDGGAVLNRTGQHKAVHIRETMLGLVLRRTKDQFVGNRQNREPYPVDVRQDLDLALITECALGGVQDLPEIYHAQERTLGRPVGFPEPELDGGGAPLALEEREQRVAVEDQPSTHTESRRRSLSTLFANEGRGGSAPAAARIGSETGGTR